MSIDFPRSRIAALQDHATRLHEGRRSGTSLASLARDLLLAFFDVCTHAGLDRVLAELAQAFPPLDLGQHAIEAGVGADVEERQ